jgi:hypothetical protein
MVNQNDLRLTNQIKYLFKENLLHKRYDSTDDHMHCVFCWERIEDSLKKYYCTVGEGYWICEECYKDFKDMFQWNVLNKNIIQPIRIDITQEETKKQI